MFVRLLFVFLTLLSYGIAIAQPCAMQGSVADTKAQHLPSAYITIYNTTDTLQTLSNEDGQFSFPHIPCGKYIIQVRYTGFAPYTDTIAADGQIHSITLQRSARTLKEVTIKQKVPLVVQRGDTLEYSSNAYKVGPDADAADLVKKMPSLDISDDKRVTAGGDPVTRVLIDGIPFYGSDALGSLKNLPAYMVDRVQVYTELSDLEKYSGFREGAGTKTINIITPAAKRNGVFGNAYGGMGVDREGDARYGTGLSLNRFNGRQRLSANAQGNNVNRQSYTDVTAAAGGSGLTSAAGGGISYADHWGRADVSGNYMLSNAGTTQYNELRRVYISPAAMGQVYEERSPSANANTGHIASMRITLSPDSASTLVLAPSVNVQQMRNTIERYGTTLQDGVRLNETRNSNEMNSRSANLSGSGTYTRRLGRGRSVSADVNAGFSGSTGTTAFEAHNVFYSSPYSAQQTDQLIHTTQRSWSATSALAYVAPAGSHGQLKAQYNTSWRPTTATRLVNDRSGQYTVPDSSASNAFEGNATSHKAGLSYRRNAGKLQLSAGLYGQYTLMQNQQTMPQVTGARFQFINVLPVLNLQYRLSSSRNLQLDHSTDTRPPSIIDLQQVVNYTDPLHLTMGDPRLRQPYAHHMKLRYNATATGGKRTLSLMMGGSMVGNYVTQSTIMAQNDTVVYNVPLLRGGQLTRPVNAQGYHHFNSNISYGLPVAAIKCKLTLSANADLTRIPLMVNSASGYMHIRNADASAKLVSSISEKVDVSLTARSMLTANSSTISTEAANVYVAHNIRPSANLLLFGQVVLNTEADMRINTGLPEGYNQNFTLWNIAMGKKIFKKRQGDIRLSVYDVLNRNVSIRHQVSDTYIQDTRSNILQRYVLLTFAYKISSFGQ